MVPQNELIKQTRQVIKHSGELRHRSEACRRRAEELATQTEQLFAQFNLNEQRRAIRIPKTAQGPQQSPETGKPL